MRSWRAVALATITVIAATATAGAGAASSPPTSEPPVTDEASTVTAGPAGATLPATETVATDAVWEKVVPGGDCACADGTEFNFWVREADPARVVLFLEGGGACFDPTSCAFTEEESTTYDWNISPDDEPSSKGGIVAFDNPDNPFADYSFVYVPYCTGDVHLGDVTREYSPELTVEHVGMVNGTAALSYLAENFADAEQVVVVGESAGSIASPVYAGLVSDLLPDAQVTVYADGSGAYPDDPDLNAGLGGLWGTFETMPDWEVNEGLTPQDWGIPRFWVQAGLHDPGDRHVTVRPRLRRSAGRVHDDHRLGHVGSRCVDRRQRSGDRGGRRHPAQLHRAGNRPHVGARRRLLRDGGRRRRPDGLGRRHRRR